MLRLELVLGKPGSGKTALVSPCALAGDIIDQAAARGEIGSIRVRWDPTA